MIEKHTVTVNRLLELAPVGTIDPTPFVYDQTMYLCAALQGLAFVTNQVRAAASVEGSVCAC
jgi:hypothetical protein